jgi:hypothetical protein
MNYLSNVPDSDPSGTKVALTMATLGYPRSGLVGIAGTAWIDEKIPRSVGGSHVLRISIERNPDALSLVLEGRLVGPWVDELRRVSGIHIVRNVPLTIDLEGLTAMDARGQALLDELRQDGATLRCSDVMNQYLVEQMGRLAGKAQETCRPCRRSTKQSDSSATGKDAFRSFQAS